MGCIKRFNLYLEFIQNTMVVVISYDIKFYVRKVSLVGWLKCSRNDGLFLVIDLAFW